MTNDSGIVTADSGIVTADSGIVTADSGRGLKSVTIDRNERSRCPGMTGHDRPESAVTMGRNTHLDIAATLYSYVTKMKRAHRER